MSEAGYIEREEYEWGPGGQPSASKQIELSKRPNRYEKFGKALEAAASYKQKKAAENQADAETGIFTDKDKDKDAVTPKGFKIGSDSTVVTGYRDPGFTLKGQEGRSLLGPIGAGLTPFFPITGQVVGAVGSLTGL